MSAALDRRALLRLAGGLTATAALGSTLPATATATVDERAGGRRRGLRDLAARRGLAVGTAVDMAALVDDARYRDVVVREFDSVTAENVMKWEAVEPERGRLDFAAADALVRFARRHRQVVRGHTLVWHNQLPSWLTDGGFGDAELRSILRRHVHQEAGHFRGRLTAWDVVNEPFEEDGSMRDTIWLRALGPEYVEDALRWASHADPRARLYVNDYNVEGLGPKSDAMYALVTRLRRRGVPVHGVGIQGHLSIAYDFPAGVVENVRRFTDLGLEVALTEVDVRMPLPVTEEKLAVQADYFDRLLRACLAERRAVSYTVWGFTDRYSWVPGTFPGEGAATPFDADYRRKPAYLALRDALTDHPRSALPS
ncbi:MAG: 1,4-beta-xylanase [Streptosporangiales bacterium]|nr:1,4-beta-xylanase [Streptosporangiales bacterium]